MKWYCYDYETKPMNKMGQTKIKIKIKIKTKINTKIKTETRRKR